jgi:nucleoside-diphosphate-sugar epimerase
MSDVTSFLRIPIEDLQRIVDLVGSRWDRLRGQRLLITGGTGFIGKWLLASFLLANRRLGLSAQVVVLSRRPAYFLEEFPELRELPELTWLNGDVRDFDCEAVSDCGFAIHAATDVVASSTPANTLDTCINGTRRLVDAMSQGGAPRRVLLLSSGAVYGRTPSTILTVSEDWSGAPDPLTPTSAYGEGKRVSELIGAMAAEAHPGLEVAIARCFAFVGPHLPLDKHFAIGNFIRAAIRKEDIHIQGDGTPMRSYLYASDLAYWLWTMLFDAPSGRAYNVGGAESISIGDLAHRVNRVLNGAGKVHIAQPPRPGIQPQAYVPAIARIASELNLSPTVGLDEAILRTAHWASQHS